MATSKRKNFEILKTLFIENKLKSKLLKTTLDRIKLAVSHKRGLTENEMTALAGYLCTNSLPEGVASSIISCMIPKDTVSDDVMEMCMKAVVLRVITPEHWKFAKKVLEWMLSCIEFGFATVDVLQNYYLHLIPFLEFTKGNSYVCKLLYLMTKPADVNDQIVAVIKKCHKHWNTKEVYLKALLSYCSRINSHSICLEDIMDPISMDKIFEAIPLPSKEVFVLVKQSSNLSQNTSVEQQIKYKEQKPIKLKYNRLIPPVKYFLPMDDLISILKFKSIEEMTPHVGNVSVPDQVLALLGDEIGHFKLLTCDENIQRRFLTVLSNTLFRVFIDLHGEYIDEEKAHFLQQIYNLCNSMQQGLNVLMPFIKSYLLTWDGESFRKEILNLIEWTVVEEKYEELFPILKNLDTLYVSGDLEMKCLITNTLVNLIGCMGKVYFRVKSGMRFPFLKSTQPKWTSNPVPMFKSTIMFVQELLLKGLVLHPNNLEILDCAIGFYETLLMYEIKCGIPMITIVPKDIFVDAVYKVDITFLERIAALILEYMKHERESIEQPLLISLRDRELYNCYINDIVNNVWFCQGFTKRREGVAHTNITDELIHNTSVWCPGVDLNEGLRIHPPVYIMADELTRKKLDEYWKEDPQGYLMKHFPESIVKLINYYLISMAAW